LQPEEVANAKWMEYKSAVMSMMTGNPKKASLSIEAMNKALNMIETEYILHEKIF
jgi:hypothetical protein